MNFVGQRQDQTADAIDPCDQHLIGSKAAADIQVTAVAVVQVAMLRFELIEIVLGGGRVHQLIEPGGGEIFS